MDHTYYGGRSCPEGNILLPGGVHPDPGKRPLEPNLHNNPNRADGRSCSGDLSVVLVPDKSGVQLRELVHQPYCADGGRVLLCQGVGLV